MVFHALDLSQLMTIKISHCVFNGDDNGVLVLTWLVNVDRVDHDATLIIVAQEVRRISKLLGWREKSGFFENE